MIIGITHEANGDARISRTVTVKVATGEAPQGEKGYPKALDHFIFLKKTQVGKEIKWVKDDVLTKHYGTNPREIWITLLSDDPESLFRTAYEAYKGRGCWCRGDGVHAMRRDLGADGKGWGELKTYSGPCAEGGCPLIESGDCSPGGDLYFMLSDFPALGSICRLHTGSYQSIRQIFSAIEDIRRITAGRLTGIQVKLFMHPDKSAWTDGSGARKTGTKWVMGLELAAADLASLKGKMLEAAQAFQSIRLSLGDGKLVIDEDDAERGRELTPEFYPAVNNAEAPASTEGKILAPENKSIIDETIAVMKRLGLTEAMIEQRLERYRDRMPELLQSSLAFEIAKSGQPAPAKAQAATPAPAPQAAKPAEVPQAQPTPPAAPAGKAGETAPLFVTDDDLMNTDFIANPEPVVVTPAPKKKARLF